MQISTPRARYDHHERRDKDTPPSTQPTIPTSLKVSNLWSLWCSTINAGALDPGGLAIIVGNLLNLLGQLSGWSKDQALRTGEQE